MERSHDNLFPALVGRLHMKFHWVCILLEFVRDYLVYCITAYRQGGHMLIGIQKRSLNIN